MQSISLRSLSLALVALSASTAFAATPDQPITRAQVHAELQQAQRTGDLLAPGESGLQLHQLFPGPYLQKAVSADQKTRAQVQQELQQARQSGELLATGESGLKNNELFPSQYARDSHTAHKTRAQVLEELQAAQRKGNVLASGESGLPLNALYPERYNAVY